MHIDVPGTEAGRSRAVIRFAAGVTAALAAAMIFGWPASHASTVFTALLLLEFQPVPLRRAARFFCQACLGLLSGLVVVHVLIPHPLLLLLVLGAVLYRIFLNMIQGGFPLVVVSWLVSFIVFPYVAQFHPGLSLAVAGGILLNLLVAFAFHWIAFLVFQPTDRPKQHQGHAALPEELVTRLAFRAALTLMLILVANMALQWGMILAVIYTAVIALSSGAEASWSAAKGKLIGNLFGGLFAIVAYYVVVATPHLLIALLAAFLLVAVFARQVFSNSPAAGAWMGACIGFLLILSGSLAPSGKEADIKTFGRISEIGFAALYVYFAYSIIDLIQGLRTNLRLPWRRFTS